MRSYGIRLNQIGEVIEEDDRRENEIKEKQKQKKLLEEKTDAEKLEINKILTENREKKSIQTSSTSPSTSPSRKENPNNAFPVEFLIRYQTENKSKPENKRVAMKIKVPSLKLNFRVEKRLLQLVGHRYDPTTKILTITEDRFESRSLNLAAVRKVFSRLLDESSLAHPAYVSMSDIEQLPEDTVLSETFPPHDAEDPDNFWEAYNDFFQKYWTRESTNLSSKYPFKKENQPKLTLFRFSPLPPPDSISQQQKVLQEYLQFLTK